MHAVFVPAAIAIAIVIAASVSPAKADSGSSSSHHKERPNLVGLRVGYLGVSEAAAADEREFLSFVFVGVSYERTLIHERLEAEVSVPVALPTGDEGNTTMPIDLHFKVPFHPIESLSPYVAAGPSLELVFADAQTEALFGLSFAAGTYCWFTPRVGVDVEVDYNLVFRDGEQDHEILVAVGPVLRF